jgi:acetyltransferase-like isoleucine patch superfamily enzyme
MEANKMYISFLRRVVLKILSLKYHNSILAHLWLKFLGIKIGKNCKFYKTPLIKKHYKSQIIIGNNVLINSSISHYSSLMIGRTKLHALSQTSKIIIGDNCGVNGSTVISRSKKIEIGKGTIIAGNCVIMDSDFHHIYPIENRWRSQEADDNVIDSEINIGDFVWIGLNCIILKGVTIGRGSVIAAGSVVVRDIPPMVVAGGNPAKIIKYIEAE